ncbi:hypothetical protein [Candidatus Venteria ishoeyi]|uniref:Secreted protein n=1 Tax=Candidatus Venteria ishoeyi TaxID=1899563 RepID=A0A1H6F753_9GAMM|nr:hypothetical protein [Candidatus Venteria ishoeyi]SEH04874.1 Uncharacterised protein [Candidatus Venteria ishoeyi]
MKRRQITMSLAVALSSALVGLSSQMVSAGIWDDGYAAGFSAGQQSCPPAQDNYQEGFNAGQQSCPPAQDNYQEGFNAGQQSCPPTQPDRYSEGYNAGQYACTSEQNTVVNQAVAAAIKSCLSDIDTCRQNPAYNATPLEVGAPGINKYLTTMCDTTQDMLEAPSGSKINASLNSAALYLNPLYLEENSYLKAKLCAFSIESDYFFKLVNLEGPVAVAPPVQPCTIDDGSTTGLAGTLNDTTCTSTDGTKTCDVVSPATTCTVAAPVQPCTIDDGSTTGLAGTLNDTTCTSTDGTKTCDVVSPATTCSIP